ncbi:MAG: hypothetical protein U0263_30130 [Polyangiaceae bacterium]
MQRLVAIALVGLAACGGPRIVVYTPLEKKTGLEQGKLYAAAEGTLLDRGYLLETRDEKSGRLETEPRTLLGSAIGRSKFRYSWKVSTADGTLRIELSCKEQGGLGDSGDCSKEAPEKLVGEQNQIAEQTLREARGQ